MSVTAKQRKEVQAVIDKWAPRLGLELWEITTEYTEVAKRDADGHHLAEVAGLNEYMAMKVTIYSDFWGQDTKAERERTLVHELLHYITSDMRRMIDRQRMGIIVSIPESNAADERATETITALMFKAYESGKKGR